MEHKGWARERVGHVIECKCIQISFHCFFLICILNRFLVIEAIFLKVSSSFEWELF